MDKLKPCPFCGSPDVDAEGWWKWWNGEWITGPACNACGGAAGSISQSPADNRAAWNTRTDSALAERVRVLEEALRTIIQHEDDSTTDCIRMTGYTPPELPWIQQARALLAQPAQSGDTEKGKE